MGGTDEPSNITHLTIAEHADAHNLLWCTHKNYYDKIAERLLLGQIDCEEVTILAIKESNSRRWKSPTFRAKMKGKWKHTAGRKLTAEHKLNISKNSKDQFGTKNAMARAVVTPEGHFGTVVEAANAAGIQKGTAYKRLAQNYPGWSYKDEI